MLMDSSAAPAIPIRYDDFCCLTPPELKGKNSAEESPMSEVTTKNLELVMPNSQRTESYGDQFPRV